MKRSPNVAVIGMATVDYIYHLPSHPVEDSENQALGHSIAVGGPAGRSSISAARLGGNVRLLATCGVGTHADILRTHLEREGISCEWVVKDQDSQHSAILVANDNATRTTVWLPQPRSDEGMFRRLRTFISGADVVLLDCTDEALTRRVITTARREHVETVVDSGSWKPWTPDVLSNVDHMIAPRKYFDKRAPTSVDEQLTQWLSITNSTVVAATDGSAGGRYSTRLSPGGVSHYAAADVDAIDTCGAGDTFHGAYAFSVGAGLGVAECFQVASWSAGLKTAGFGNDTIPTWSGLEPHLGSSTSAPSDL